jgi:flagellin
MRGQIGGLAQAQRNAQDGVSLVQTGEGALNEVHAMLQRVRELRVQYGNDTLNATDKTAIRAEVAQLATEIGTIKTNTKFNGTSLLNATGTVALQVGANDSESITINTSDLVGGAGMAEVVASATTATDAGFVGLTMADIDTAIQEVSTKRADFGAVQNRLEHRLANLGSYQENLIAAESRIRDVDMAEEMVKFTKSQILQQAGTSMLSQANQAPQSVLSLLR